MHMVLRTLSRVLVPYLNAPRWWVALSGGLDSVALLHALATWRQQADLPALSAIHINHQMSPNADVWQQHCQQLAESQSMPFVSASVTQTVPVGESVEHYLREARYALLAEKIAEGDCVLSAHHQDDQAETLLLQLLRGAGPEGLQSMPLARPLGQGQLLRPFLSVARDDLLAYAKTYDLRWVEDESNSDMRFDRNYIRQKVMPLLQARWPAAKQRLTKVCEWQVDAAQCLRERAANDVATLRLPQASCLSVAALASWPLPRQMAAIRYYLAELSAPLPREAPLREWLSHVFSASEDKLPQMCWRSRGTAWWARRFQDQLYFSHCDWPVQKTRHSTWFVRREPLTLMPGLQVQSEEIFSKQQLSLLGDAALTCRWAVGGKTAKKYFQAECVPPWWRSYIPLFYYEGCWLKPRYLHKLLAYFYQY